MALLDKSRRVVAALVGRPVGCTGWEKCWRMAENALREAEGSDCMIGSTSPRRGDFPCLAAGVSYGGGQKVGGIIWCCFERADKPQAPGNLKHNTQDADLLEKLTKNPYFNRMARFANGMPSVVSYPQF